jgi:protein subunit release factor A
MEKKYNTDLDTLKDEVEITLYKSSGPGGQRKNRRETAVRIHHTPSGITVIATEHTSQARNKELAWRRLQERLEQLNRSEETKSPDQNAARCP